MRAIRLVAAAGALALSGALTVPVSAAPAAFSLTVTGTRSGYADVTVTDLATFDPGAFSVTTTGSYAGFVLATDGSIVAGGVTATGWPGGPFDVRQKPVELAAGRYRLYLLTDGRSSVKVDLRGRGTTREVAARRPVTASGNVLDLGQPLTVTKRVPLPGGARVFALLGLHYRADVSVARRVSLCFRPDSVSDCDVKDFTVSGLNLLAGVTAIEVAFPGDLPGTAPYGVFHVDGAAVGSRTLGFYLTFDAS